MEIEQAYRENTIFNLGVLALLHQMIMHLTAVCVFKATAAVTMDCELGVMFCTRSRRHKSNIMQFGTTTSVLKTYLRVESAFLFDTMSTKCVKIMSLKHLLQRYFHTVYILLLLCPPHAFNPMMGSSDW